MSTIEFAPIPGQSRVPLSQAWARLPRLTLSTVAVFLLAGLVIAQAAHSFTDPDYWWHFKTGEFIVTHRAIPRVDIFSSTAAGRPWVTHEWLAEVLIYLLVQAGGYGTALAAFTLAPLASVVVLWRLLTKERVNPRAGIPVLALSTLMIAMYGTVRPQILSWLMFSVLVYALYGYHSGRLRHLWGLPLLFVVWANLHLSFTLGLALLAVFIGSVAGQQLIARERPRVTHLLVILAASVAASCLNPNGARLLIYPLQYLPLRETFLPAIAEWKSPDFQSVVFAPLLVALAILLVTGVNPGRLDLWPLSLGLFTAALALESARYDAVFAIAFVPIAGTAIRDRWTWAAQAQTPPTGSRAALNWALCGITVAAIALAFRPSTWSEFRHDPRTSGQPIPVDAVNVIAQQYPNARIFNQYEWGGYLIYRLWPNQRPFVDGRGEMFPPELLTQYLDAYVAKPGWSGILDRYGINLVLVRSDSPLAGALETNPGWRLVKSDKVAAIYVRG
jgi:hypothetical protein